MTLKEIIKTLKKHQPRSASVARHVGLPMRHIGEGAFRKVYRIGSRYVIKFPHATGSESLQDSIDHSNREVSKIEELSAYDAVQPLLPKIYFHDPHTGAILMKYYPKAKHTAHHNLDTALEVIGKLISALTHQNCVVSDMHSHNAVFTTEGMKLLDLGYDEYYD